MRQTVQALASRHAGAEHVCAACGYTSARWFGRCPECGEWSSAPTSPASAPSPAITSLVPDGQPPERVVTGMCELDRVLGGGLVAGSAILIAGEPGIGKSTLVLQLMDGVIERGRSALLMTGEESVAQVALRGARLDVAADRFLVSASSSLEEVVAASLSLRPDVVVIDSVQTLRDGGLEGAAGSVLQVRECAATLVAHAKETGTVVVMVGHVTKEGAVAGPKALEHVVDAVLTLDGERDGSLRTLRVSKNRFGSCTETGVLKLGASGLESVEDPSAMMLEDRLPGIPGSVVFPCLEGSRPVLVEIQALLTPTPHAQPRRVAIGVDGRRLTLLLGVLSERCDESFHSQDVFVAAAGGLAVREPAADLALCLALLSAKSGVCIDQTTTVFGEVGLGGEIRRVPATQSRVDEAMRMGFRTAIVPRGTGRSTSGIKETIVGDIRDAWRACNGALEQRRP
ncbi:MAG: DNA repair protein RadA [Actinomycetota bacterium]|nr:DNA repair protein RadA [Actinomycetota bacterium]